MEVRQHVMDFGAPEAMLSNQEGLLAAKTALKSVAARIEVDPEPLLVDEARVATPQRGGAPHYHSEQHRPPAGPSDLLDWHCPDTLLHNGKGLGEWHAARLALGHVANGLNPEGATLPVRVMSPTRQSSPLSTIHVEDTIAMLQTAKEALQSVAEEMEYVECDAGDWLGVGGDADALATRFRREKALPARQQTV